MPVKSCYVVQRELAESTRKDTFELDKGPDKDFVAEAKRTKEYAEANEEVNRLQALLDDATKDLNAFNEANPDTVENYRKARKEVDDPTTMAIADASRDKDASAEAIRMSPVLALMSSSLRPERSEIAAAREQVADKFTSVGPQQALVDAINSKAVMTRDVAIGSLLEQYNRATSDADRKALCADMVIHLRQTPEFNDYLAAPDYKDVRDQVDLVKDVDNVGSLYLRNPQAIMALAEQVGMDPEMRKPYETAAKLLPDYNHYLELTAKHDGMQFQYDTARIDRERVVSSHVAKESVHAAAIDGRQAVEAAGSEWAALFSPQLAKLKTFETKLMRVKESDPEEYQKLVTSPEATQVKSLADKLKKSSDQYTAYKAEYEYGPKLRQGNTRTMSTGHVANIKTRDAKGQEVIWGRLSATVSNSQQTGYGGGGSFILQHMFSASWRLPGMALGLIKTPLQAYNACLKKAAEENGCKWVMQRDAAGKETGLFRFVHEDGSPVTAREHSRILQRASIMTSEMGNRYHMRIAEHEVDADTWDAERAGELGLTPTDAIAPTPSDKTRSNAPQPLDEDQRKHLQHRLVEIGAESEKAHGLQVFDIKAQLSKDKRLLVLEGPGFNFGDKGDGIAMRGVEPTGQDELGEHYRVRVLGDDTARDVTIVQTKGGDVEFYHQGENKKLNLDQIKRVLAGAAAGNSGVEILHLTTASKAQVLANGEPGAQVPGRGAQATDIKAPQVPGDQAENAPAENIIPPTPT